MNDEVQAVARPTVHDRFWKAVLSVSGVLVLGAAYVGLVVGVIVVGSRVGGWLFLVAMGVLPVVGLIAWASGGVRRWWHALD